MQGCAWGAVASGVLWQAAMRTMMWIGVCAGLAACAADELPDHDIGEISDDARVVACQPAPPAGPFTRSASNPRLQPGQMFGDGMIDTIIADPDLHWDVPTQRWSLYYMSGHGASFTAPLVQTIRHATSIDGNTFTLSATPAIAASSDPAAWDHGNTETPSVAYSPDAPADRRYVLMYSGALAGIYLPGAAQTTPRYGIGVAFSADGVTFTRVSAAASPHGQPGFALAGSDVYPSAHIALVADPEVVYRNGVYHVWFSSYACAGSAANVCATTTAYGIGHAVSRDAIHWTPDAINPVPSLLHDRALPYSGGAQPSVVWDPAHCRYEMWLTSDAAGEVDYQPVLFNNMAGVWRATSTDGVSWSINYGGARDLSWNPAVLGEHWGLLTGADVAIKGDERRMVYVGFEDRNVPPGLYVPLRTVPPSFWPGVFDLNVATRNP